MTNSNNEQERRELIESFRQLLLHTDDVEKFVKMMELMPMIDLYGFIIFNIDEDAVPATIISGVFDSVEIDERRMITFSRESSIAGLDNDFEVCIPESEIISVTPYEKEGEPTLDVEVGNTIISITFLVHT